MEYSFNIDYAQEFGVSEAIMIKNFQFWIKKNSANKDSNHDGRTWTFNSAIAFKKLFPFWSTGQINRTLNSLVSQEVLMVGNYNKAKYDRTKWFAFIDEASFVENDKCTSRKQKMDLPKTKNAIVEINQPIPDSKHKIENKDDKHIYKMSIDIYHKFCLSQLDAPAKIDGVQGKAMKTILSYLKTLCKQKGNDSQDAILSSLKYIFGNWNKLEPFLQKQIKLSQINSNLVNIIQDLKNDTNKNNIADDILAKYR